MANKASNTPSKILLHVLIFVCLTLPTVYASDITIIVTPSNIQRIDIHHDQSEEITYTLEHKQSGCDIKCTYALFNANTRELVDHGYFTRTPSQKVGDFTVTVQAPPLNKAYSKTGTIPYSLEVQCSETGFLCNDVGEIQSYSIFLDYSLSQELQSADDQIQ
ncbi:MAG: hypothetical protein ABIH41_03405, partial [Nanoarchaeota archaeon]